MPEAAAPTSTPSTSAPATSAAPVSTPSAAPASSSAAPSSLAAAKSAARAGRPSSAPAAPKSTPAAAPVRKMRADPGYESIMAQLTSEAADESAPTDDANTTTDDGAGTGEESAPAAEAPTTPTIAPELLARATAAGLTEAIAADLGDDLETYIDAIESEQLPVRAANPANPAPQPRGNPAAAPAAQPNNPANPKAEKIDHLAHLRGKFDDALLDGMNEGLEKMVAGDRATIQQLQQRLGDRDAQAEAARMERDESEFEAAFTSPGDEFASLLGKGATEALTPGSPEQRLRFAIAREVATDRVVRREIAARTGRPEKAPSIKEAVRRVLVAKFPNRIRQAERETIRKESARRQATAIDPPNHSKAAGSDGDSSLLAEIKAIRERPE